ncbi:hypothetical protein NGA54_10680, partial [Streptococcus suis]|uniref:hypothetical protein n=1 Tax=Streptococcus suis TaxID=1307 RepID=UPI00207CCF8D
MTSGAIYGIGITAVIHQQIGNCFLNRFVDTELCNDNEYIINRAADVIPNSPSTLRKVVVFIQSND